MCHLSGLTDLVTATLPWCTPEFAKHTWHRDTCEAGLQLALAQVLDVVTVWRALLWWAVGKQDVLRMLCGDILVSKDVVGDNPETWRPQRLGCQRVPVGSSCHGWAPLHGAHQQSLRLSLQQLPRALPASQGAVVTGCCDAAQRPSEQQQPTAPLDTLREGYLGLSGLPHRALHRCSF